MRSRVEFALALLLDLLGAAGALLIASRTWQTVVTPRPRPLADDVLRLTGRTVDSAPTALGLVALAGVVAVLATRGVARRIVGAALACAGAALVWRSITAMSAVSAARARSLVQAKHSGVGVDGRVVPHVTVHAVWPVLVLLCALAVLLGGAAIAVWGHRGVALSSRYEAPAARASAEAQRTSTALWNDLDRGHDPTGESRSSTPDSGR